jgi:RNA polymerase sigma factor (sigma-70 family)
VSTLVAQTDERLLVLARLGDEAAFEAIVKRYRPLLLGHSRRIVGDGAQDAVQQAFMSAWSALRRGCVVRDLRAWLFTIAHRASLQALREQGQPAYELPESLACGPTPDEHAEQRAHTRETLAAIAELPGLERDALVWTSVHGRSGRDTAHALGVSEADVRQLVYRARGSIRATARAYLPPIALPPIAAPRVLARLGFAARRALALVDRLFGAGSTEAIGPFAKLTAVLAAGAVLAAPVVAVRFGARHDGQTAAERIGGSAVQPVRSAGDAPRIGARRAGAGGPSALGSRGRRGTAATATTPTPVADRSDAITSQSPAIASQSPAIAGERVPESAVAGARAPGARAHPAAAPPLRGVPAKATALTAQTTAPLTTPALAGQTLSSVAGAVQRVGSPVAQGVAGVVAGVAPATQGVQSVVNGAVEHVVGVVQGLTAPPGTPTGPNAALSLP